MHELTTNVPIFFTKYIITITRPTFNRIYFSYNLQRLFMLVGSCFVLVIKTNYSPGVSFKNKPLYFYSRYNNKIIVYFYIFYIVLFFFLRQQLNMCVWGGGVGGGGGVTLSGYEVTLPLKLNKYLKKSFLTNMIHHEK